MPGEGICARGKKAEAKNPADGKSRQEKILSGLEPRKEIGRQSREKNSRTYRIKKRTSLFLKEPTIQRNIFAKNGSMEDHILSLGEIFCVCFLLL